MIVALYWATIFILGGSKLDNIELTPTKSVGFFMRFKLSTMPTLSTSLIRFLLFTTSILLIYSCQNDDDDDSIPAYAEWDCDADTGDVLVREWSDLVFLGGSELCLDTLCMYFTLDLREDATYQWDYLLFKETTDSTYMVEHHDSGNYEFRCDMTGYFTTALTYDFVEGTLLLNSDTGVQDSLNIDWDGFYGLQFQGSAFDPNLNLGTFVLPN